MQTPLLARAEERRYDGYLQIKQNQLENIKTQSYHQVKPWEKTAWLWQNMVWNVLVCLFCRNNQFVPRLLGTEVLFMNNFDVCIHVCIFVCMYVYLYIYIYICICIYYVYMYMYVYVDIYLYVCICFYVCICRYISICMYMFICLYM